MKKIIGITGIILIACSIITAVYAPVSSAENTAEAQFETADAVQESVEKYIVRAENGLVVVYRAGEKTPFIKTDCSVANLPAADIVYLEKGIEIDGSRNLEKILEDYCS